MESRWKTHTIAERSNWAIGKRCDAVNNTKRTTIMKLINKSHNATRFIWNSVCVYALKCFKNWVTKTKNKQICLFWFLQSSSIIKIITILSFWMEFQLHRSKWISICIMWVVNKMVFVGFVLSLWSILPFDWCFPYSIRNQNYRYLVCVFSVSTASR